MLAGPSVFHVQPLSALSSPMSATNFNEAKAALAGTPLAANKSMESALSVRMRPPVGPELGTNPVKSLAFTWRGIRVLKSDGRHGDTSRGGDQSAETEVKGEKSRTRQDSQGDGHSSWAYETLAEQTIV